MKIPDQFVQFDDKEVLLIVTGKQDAVLYRAHNHELDRIDAFKIPKPHYSDHAGKFKGRGRGLEIISGGVGELRDKDIIKDFIHQFKLRIKNITFSFAKIYIFSPEKTKQKIYDALPKAWQEKVEKIIDGNYFYQHPMYLVEKIATANNKV